MAIVSMGKFTAIGMRTHVPDKNALIISTCGKNDTAERGTFDSWSWCNPTNRIIQHTLPADPTVKAVSVECMWQGTKILKAGDGPNKPCLDGNWRLGKAKRPVGAWDGPDRPLITDPGLARVRIYLPVFRALIEHWMQDDVVKSWVDAARNHPGDVYMRDHDTGRGIWRNGPMSHAWVFCMFLNDGVWPS